MSLIDFFRINLPYGIKKNLNNEWVAFNREYLPLGWNKKENFKDILSFDFPIYTKYKGITEHSINRIIKNPSNIHRNESGEIVLVYFYNDDTNPKINPKCWGDYIEIIKSFCQFSAS